MKNVDRYVDSSMEMISSAFASVTSISLLPLGPENVNVGALLWAQIQLVYLVVFDALVPFCYTVPIVIFLFEAYSAIWAWLHDEEYHIVLLGDAASRPDELGVGLFGLPMLAGVAVFVVAISWPLLVPVFVIVVGFRGWRQVNRLRKKIRQVELTCHHSDS